MHYKKKYTTDLMTSCKSITLDIIDSEDLINHKKLPIDYIRSYRSND